MRAQRRWIRELLDSRWPVCVVLLLGACGPQQPSPKTAQRRAALQAGSSDSGHPAVGVLRAGSGACTATLIGRATVLTAAHCVRTRQVQFIVCPESTVCDARRGRVYDSTQVLVHPDYRGIQGDQHDIAIVLLNAIVSETTPTAINTAALEPIVGWPITLIGFGQPGFGTRRVGDNTIATVAAQTFTYRGLPNVDHGDSGGPTMIVGSDGAERVIGVHSTKGTSGGTDIRVDVFADWIVESAASDVLLPEGDLPDAAQLPPALEGQSCAVRGCAESLVCVPVYGGNQERGRFCMERCSSPDRDDPACDGNEVCRQSRSEGVGAVCVDLAQPYQGYTNRDPADEAGPAPAAPGADSALPPDAGPNLPPSTRGGTASPDGGVAQPPVADRSPEPIPLPTTPQAPEDEAGGAATLQAESSATAQESFEQNRLAGGCHIDGAHSPTELLVVPLLWLLGLLRRPRSHLQGEVRKA